MNGTRADRLERLQAIKRRMREIEEMRLAELRARARSLAEEAEAILRSLGDESLMHGLFLDAKAGRLRRKEAERLLVLAEAEAAERRVAAAGGAEKRLERIAGRARTLQNGADDARSLAELLDAYLTRPSA